MSIRIALLDMNNGVKNQGFGNIQELVEQFKKSTEDEVWVQTYDVRRKDELPELQDFDICISSGGPGDPNEEGLSWLPKYQQFLDAVYQHNLESEEKKYLFLICHSFQLACIHWKLGLATQRRSYSFGIFKVHKTEEGEKEYLFRNLPEPFYVVDSRAYQIVQPNDVQLETMGAEIVALEKLRLHINLERAVMAIRFSDEIFGTQFHPEANPVGFLENLQDEEIKQNCIETHGQDKYDQIIDRLDDEDKIILTQKEIIPGFLKDSARKLQSVEV